MNQKDFSMVNLVWKAVPSIIKNDSLRVTSNNVDLLMLMSFIRALSLMATERNEKKAQCRPDIFMPMSLILAFS